LIQIGDQVIDMFDFDGKLHSVFRDAERQNAGYFAVEVFLRKTMGRMVFQTCVVDLLCVRILLQYRASECIGWDAIQVASSRISDSSIRQ